MTDNKTSSSQEKTSHSSSMDLNDDEIKQMGESLSRQNFDAQYQNTIQRALNMFNEGYRSYILELRERVNMKASVISHGMCEKLGEYLTRGKRVFPDDDQLTCAEDKWYILNLKEYLRTIIREANDKIAQCNRQSSQNPYEYTRCILLTLEQSHSQIGELHNDLRHISRNARRVNVPRYSDLLSQAPQRPSYPPSQQTPQRSQSTSTNTAW